MNNEDFFNFIKNELPDNIKNIIDNYINEGLQIYNGNHYNYPNFQKYNGWDNLVKYWNFSIYLMCHLLYFKNIRIKCFLTGNIINSNSSDILYIYHDPLITYYFPYYLFSDGINTCVLVYGGPYYLPMFIYYIEKQECYDLLYGNNFGCIYSCNESYKLIIELFLKRYNEKQQNLLLSKLDNNPGKISMIFANNFQSGHYIWNEVSGVELLIKTDLIKNIDNLLLSRFDICNVHELIKEKNPNCKIINIKDYDKIEGINFYGAISGYFMTSEAQKYLFYSIKNPIKFNKKIVIMIVIKADRRLLIDMDSIYIQLINKLVENNILNPNELLILFDGLYKDDNIGTNYYDAFKEKYITVINNICNNIHKDIEYKSLIGLKFNEILSYYNNINYWIGQGGSCIEVLIQSNINGLIITPDYSMYGLNQQICYIQNRRKHSLIIGESVDINYKINFNELYNIVVEDIKKIIIDLY